MGRLDGEIVRQGISEECEVEEGIFIGGGVYFARECDEGFWKQILCFL